MRQAIGLLAIALFLGVASDARAQCPGTNYDPPFRAYGGYCRADADINLDKRNDVVFSGASNVFVFLSQGRDQFSAAIPALTFESDVYKGYFVRLEDRSGDGIPDLVYVGEAHIFWLSGSRDGKFNKQRNDFVIPQPPAPQQQRVELGSMDITPCSKWSGIVPTFADQRLIAYADADYQAAVTNQVKSAVQACAAQGVAACGLTSLISSPAACLPAFKIAVSACLTQKGSNINFQSLGLSVESKCMW